MAVFGFIVHVVSFKIKEMSDDDTISTFGGPAHPAETVVSGTEKQSKPPLPDSIPGRKTPLPDYALLPGFGTTSTELFNDVCSCGRPLGRLAYDAAIARAAAGENTAGSRVFKDWASSLNLKLCCRTQILEPVVAFIVSADIFATDDSGESSATVPKPSTILTREMIPPPLLLHSGTSAADIRG
jgi:hypothetical protein